MSTGPKISELKKVELKTGGGGSEGAADCFIIERATNGLILRIVTGLPDEPGSIVEDVLVYTNSSDMLRDLAKYL